MATESSAVVRFIDLAQRSQNPVRPTQPAPITSEFGTEVLSREVRRRPRRAPLVIGALVLAAGAAAGGVVLGKNGLGGPDGSGQASAPAKAAAAAPIAAADRDQAAPAAPAAPAEAPATPSAPEPQVTAPVVSAPSEILAATGFDIRVEPGATISLDGSVLGKAPLRVRNLQPGAHVLDLEAPPGYFSRRVELALAAGEAKDLRLALDPIEEDAPTAAATASDDKPKASSSASRRARAEARRDRKEKARQEKERKKEMRAARVAAAKSAKKSTVVAEPLKDEPKAKAKDDQGKTMSAADAELEAAISEITGKPAPKRSASAAASAGASSLAASEPGAISGKGTLMLGSKPPCDIILDGKPTGLKTPQRAMELSAGTHSVTLVNPELGIEKKFKVKIAAGKTTKAIQDLSDKLD